MNLPTPIKFVIHAKVLDILYRTKIGAILAYFCPYLVAMATPIGPLVFAVQPDGQVCGFFCERVSAINDESSVHKLRHVIYEHEWQKFGQDRIR